MKKYEKPRIVFEHFELNHSIANCSPAMNHSQLTCKYESDELFGFINGSETVFASGDCTYTIAEFSEKYEGFCLQTGTDGFNLFTS